ncbi:hypothetical protein PBV87_21430 [Niameybacter massiliensis]|uniref:Uncharacterized protein n=1 Tax=Holtiella tumoricola TaxID=3018743 RepID=A0AA42DRL2_9FIRM|nr:hypothetical protein [Holtiella tumoricola]MDA3734040.1 hypothetical protein [Holtiella tumoricola]
MQHIYEENVHYLTDMLFEAIEEEPRKKLFLMQLEMLLQGLGGLMCAILYRQVIYQWIYEGIGPIMSLRERMIVAALSTQEVYNRLEMMESLMLIPTSLMALGGVGMAIMGLYTLIKQQIGVGQCLRYFDIPAVGTNHWGIAFYEEDENIIFRQTSFECLEEHLGNEYLECLWTYQWFINKLEVTPSVIRYWLMINLLASLAHKKGILNKIERKLLIKEIKTSYKALSIEEEQKAA